MTDLDDLLDRLLRKDRTALARLVTLASQERHAAAIHQRVAHAGRRSPVIGVTGNAGVGKSSLICALAQLLRDENHTVAVLACDPESPISGGALLGDRVRIAGTTRDDGLFIRSLATKPGQQAVAGNLDVLAEVLSAFGFDIIVLETVGAGQGDTAVRELCDVLVLLLQPQTGDELQWEKAGLLEVADIVVIHKADLPGAERMRSEVERELNMPGCRTVPVLAASAMTRSGLQEVWNGIEALLRSRPASNAGAPGDQSQTMRGEMTP